MEAYGIGSEFMDSLHLEMRRRPVEHCHSATVVARRVRRDDAITSRPAGVDSVSEFFSWKMPRSMLAWDTPLNADPSPLLQPLRIL